MLTCMCVVGASACSRSDGDSIGTVNVKTLPPPPAPPPTIIRFGDVGVAAAGCPMCPVLDPEAVAKQKETIKHNQERIARMDKLMEANSIKIEEGIESMKARGRPQHPSRCRCPPLHDCEASLDCPTLVFHFAFFEG